MKRWGFCKLRIASTTGQCDFKSKDRHYFKRHTMESHNKLKVFFIMSKSENAFNKDPLELETGSDYHGEN